MVKSNININDVKQKIMELQGKCVNMRINKGRNKIVELSATIDKIYPSMFVIVPNEIVDLDRTSFSYNDVLCGDVKFGS